MIVKIEGFDEETEEIILKAAEVVNQVYKLSCKVSILPDKKIPMEACAIEAMPGTYFIAINPIYLEKFSTKDIVVTIAHELTHIKQFLKDGLTWDDDVACYRGDYYRDENLLEYWFAPWEVEARGMELAFWHLYVENE